MTQTPPFPLSRPIARRPAAGIGVLDPGSPLLREPVVLTGASQVMEEVWRWTPAFLRKVIGTERLPATLPGPDGRFRYEPGRALDSQPLPVAQFFDDVAYTDGPRWCLQQVSVEQELPALASRLDYPSCVRRELLNAINLWLAAPLTVTPLHYDATHNLFAQVSGSKTFYLFPPESLDALYPGPLNTGAQHISQIDLFHPDFTRHPLAASLSYREVTVSAGEALILPAFWWHQVISHDVSVSVNFWWQAHVLDCLCPGFMRKLRSTAVRDDLSELTRTFEIGQRDAADLGATDAVKDAAGLARLLSDIGEHDAAVALSLSILHTMCRQQHAASRKAAEVLARCGDLAESRSLAGSSGPEEAARLVGEITMII
jgi:hypothetical protein